MKFIYKWMIATLAGAAINFVWGGISHMLLFKGIGFTRMSNEERIVSTLGHDRRLVTGRRRHRKAGPPARI